MIRPPPASRHRGGDGGGIGEGDRVAGLGTVHEGVGDDVGVAVGQVCVLQVQGQIGVRPVAEMSGRLNRLVRGWWGLGCLGGTAGGPVWAVCWIFGHPRQMLPSTPSELVQTGPLFPGYTYPFLMLSWAGGARARQGPGKGQARAGFPHNLHPQNRTFSNAP